jgi:hypothetical protein
VRKGGLSSSLIKRFLHLEREDEPFLSAKREITPITDRVAALEDGITPLPVDLAPEQERSTEEIEAQRRKDQERAMWEMQRQKRLALDARFYEEQRLRRLEDDARRQRAQYAAIRLFLRVGVPLLILYRIAAC